MPAALVVRFRPAGPWRLGPDNGAKDRTDRIFHSDSLFSALTHAMRDLGWLDEWIGVTVESPEPAVRLSSCFPYTGRTLLIQPPRNLWPIAQTGKLRWKAARFIPTNLVPVLLREEEPREDQWAVDPVSECLLPVTKNGPLAAPFRVVRRRCAAVDRVTETSETAHSLACLQFASGAGMWFAAAFSTDDARNLWSDRLRSAIRLLADTGIGGARSRGWGRSEEPRFESADLARMLTGTPQSDGAETAWWLLSLFSPGDNEQVDWNRGNYAVCARAGRIESAAHWGGLKPAIRMIAEGSVLLSGTPPAGTARNVPAAELPHPVYRSGIALAVPLPWKESRRASFLAPPAAAEPAPSEAPAQSEAMAETPEPKPPEIEPEPPETPVQEPPQPEPPAQEPPPELPPAGDPEPVPPPVHEPTPEASDDTTEEQPS